MECIIFRRGYTKKVAPVSVERRSSKKPNIQAGIHATNLRSWYTKPELVAWCKDNDVALLSSLKKEVVIRRILRSLEEDKENSSAASNKNKPAPSAPKKAANHKKMRNEDNDDDKESSEEEEASENVEMKNKEETSQMEVEEESGESEKEEEEEKDLGSDLKGKVFAITGKFNMERKDIVSLIEKRGGSVKSSITKEVHYLLCADGDNASAKVIKARQEGVKILGADFLVQLE